MSPFARTSAALPLFEKPDQRLRTATLIQRQCMCATTPFSTLCEVEVNLPRSLRDSEVLFIQAFH